MSATKNLEKQRNKGKGKGKDLLLEAYKRRTPFDLLKGNKRLGRKGFILPFNKGGIVSQTKSKFKGHY